MQPGRTSKLTFDKFICIFLSVALVVAGSYLGWANDVLGQFHRAIYGEDTQVSEHKTSGFDSSNSISNEAISASTSLASETAVAGATGAVPAVAGVSAKSGDVQVGKSNERENITVDVKTKVKQNHSLSYVWYGLPASGTNFYDAHGSRVFPVIPLKAIVREGNSYVIDQTYAKDYRLYTHKNNEDAGDVVGVYTFSGWFDWFSGIMPDDDLQIVGYWSFENTDGVSSCNVSYAWSGVVPASNVVLKDEAGSIVTPKLPEATNVVLGDSIDVDSTYTKGYQLTAYNFANKRLGIYTFSGWDASGTLTPNTATLSITGTWTYDGVEATDQARPDAETYIVVYSWEGAPDAGLSLSNAVELPKAQTVEVGSTYVKDSTYTENTTVDLLSTAGEVQGTFKFSGWTKTETAFENITYTGKWTYSPKDEKDTIIPKTTNTVGYAWKDAPASDLVLYDSDGKVVASPKLPEASQLALGNSGELDATYVCGCELFIHNANGRVSGKYVFSGWKLKGEEAPATFTMEDESILFEGEWDFVAIREVAPAVTGQGSVTVTTDAEEKTATSTSSEGTTPSSNISGDAQAVLVKAEAGDTVSVNVKPKEGWYVAQVRFAVTPAGYVYGTGDPLAYYAILPNSKGEYTFIMPTNHVTLFVDFVSIVWDGTIDLTWYDKNSTSFDLKYAAQFAGLAAIVNGLFTNYPTSQQVVKAQDRVHEITVDMPDYNLFQKGMGVSGENSELYGAFTSTYTVADSQTEYDYVNKCFHRSATVVTRTQRVIGDPSAIKSICASTAEREDSQNVTTWEGYWIGGDSFKGKKVYISSDLDFGAKQDENGTWLTSSPLFMPVGGQYCVLPGLTQTNAYSKLSASFCGYLDGLGHEFKNVYAEYYADTNFGDSQSVGIVGRLGCHDSDAASICPTNPTVRQIVLKSGYISARRSVGGIVGKTGKTTSDYEKGNDGSVGAIVELCINWASVNSTDKKGCGGIVGAAWNNGLIQNCANFGTIVSRVIQNPTGGIAGSNEKLIRNCYNVGEIVAFNPNFSEGIATDNGGNSEVQNCYWLRDTSTNGGYHTTNEGATNTCYEFGTNCDIYMLTPDLLNDGADAIWVDGSSLPELFNEHYYYPALFFQVKRSGE